MISIDTFVKERDKMLLKRSVPALREFVEKHADLYGAEFVDSFRAASDEIAEITLHKMIANCTNLPKTQRIISRLWLISRGFSADIEQREL
jgi:hypothetical protein